MSNADPRINELRGEAASLVRTHLWRSENPPPLYDPVRDCYYHGSWNMGRELSIWNALVAEGEDPEVVNGAITKVRALTRISGPLTLKIFYGRGGKTRPIFEQCKSAWLKDSENKPKRFMDVLREIVADG